MVIIIFLPQNKFLIANLGINFLFVLTLILDMLGLLKEIQFIKQEIHSWHGQHVSTGPTSLLLEGLMYPLQVIWYNSLQACLNDFRNST